MEIKKGYFNLSRSNRPVGGTLTNDSGSFYSRGKLLVTGEYAILQGAGGLALPVSRGQDLKWVDPGGSHSLEWTTSVNGRKIFNAVFKGSNYFPVTSGDRKMAVFLRKILVRAAKMAVTGPIFGRINSELDFDIKWGLGSSSSLISNIAYLFDLNPFTLHSEVSTGSAYDIACSRSDTPILYRLSHHSESSYGRPVSGHTDFYMPVYREVEFHPPFREKLYFAWTGKKQDSARSVKKFLSRLRYDSVALDEISRITSEIIKSSSIQEFNRLLTDHDRIISGLIDQTPVNDSVFDDIPGYVKSLGAWGGDFIMITWEGEFAELLQRLKPKGIDIVFPYDRLIYHSH
jgi:mevalonate kinase